MALMQRNYTKIAFMAARINLHSISSVQGSFSVRSISNAPNKERDVKKSVFISQSNDVFTNLALESWMHKNFDFSNHHVLLVAKNDPCVIIGNNQNPWVETNVANINHLEADIPLARRQNNGTAVYNDHGNLNMTFFTPLEHHDPKYNMDIVSRALFRKYSMKVNVSAKKDLTVYNKTITTNGSKLGEINAYHHCSLLVDVDKVALTDALLKKEGNNKTTSSVRAKKSKFMNVREVTPQAKVDDITSAIGWEYMRTFAYSLKDGGKELAHQQKGFQMINPTDKWFPGISEIRSHLTNWNWCYGKTPKFSISRQFPVPMGLLGNYQGSPPDLCITVKVENGKISDVSLFIPPGLTSSGFSGEAKVITSLKGHKFSEDALSSLEYYLRAGESDYMDDKDKFVTECVRQVMVSI